VVNKLLILSEAHPETVPEVQSFVIAPLTSELEPPLVGLKADSADAMSLVHACKLESELTVFKAS